jgi:queuine/archaeosine tRNA-ribosyltransferase
MIAFGGASVPEQTAPMVRIRLVFPDDLPDHRPGIHVG